MTVFHFVDADSAVILTHAQETYEALLALYHAVPPHVLDGAPELEQTLSVLQKVSGKVKP
mgnify:CR=1 FL=1